MTQKLYDIVYANPPWVATKRNRKPDSYVPMKTSDIINLDVESIVKPNAHCYLWSLNSTIPDALKVMRAWGFEYITMITWVKDYSGLGQYFLGETEHCLFGVRGNIPYKIGTDGKRFQRPTYFYSKYPTESEKPENIRDIISHVSDRDGFNKVELFARKRYRGWDAWGNDIADPNIKILKKETLFTNYDIFKND